MELTAGDIAAATGGSLKRGMGRETARGVSIDTRALVPGEVFFGLKGPNFDGGEYAGEALSKGAAGVVAEGPVRTDQGFAIEVENALEALGHLASWYRGSLAVPVVAIGGSAGKTTTKEMAASVLGRTIRVHKTEGNRNNLVGVPLTLFGLSPEHRAAVLELGISEPWEMARLVEISSPRVAVLTNIGRAHLEGLGSREGVARAKEALFTSLGPEGVRVVNLDDPLVVRVAGDGGPRVTYGGTSEADIRLAGFTPLDGLAGVVAEYDIRGERITARIKAPGGAGAVNGAAAIAACVALDAGLSIEEIALGLEEFTPAKGRMEVYGAGGVTIIDDTYNSNPESLSAALKTLSSARGRKVAVLGDMLELGAGADAAHREAGSVAADAGVELLVAVGRYARMMVEGAVEAGVPARGLLSFDTGDEALEALSSVLCEGDTVLVKGSRALALESVAEGLKHRLRSGALI